MKDHWYQARLLCSIWPRPMKAHADVADQLGDMLGKHHDLGIECRIIGRCILDLHDQAADAILERY